MSGRPSTRSPASKLPGCLILAAFAVVSGLASTAEERTPLAQVHEDTIYVDEVEGALAFRLYQLELDIYSLLKGEAERRIESRLLAEAARAQDKTVDALLEEIESGDEPVEEATISAYLSEHPPRDGADPVRARERVRKYLTERAKLERRIVFLTSLREAAGARVLLAPPERPRTEFAIGDAPTRGPANAPINIVHFASFGSRNSARSAEKLARLDADFPNQIRFAHVNLLADRDEAGLRAARLGFAVAERGRFWTFHDALFAAGGRLDPEKIASIAASAGLPEQLAERANDAPERLRQVKADIDRAVGAGVPREPGLFVNGLFVSGLLPYEDLHALLVEELERVRAIELETNP